MRINEKNPRLLPRICLLAQGFLVESNPIDVLLLLTTQRTRNVNRCDGVAFWIQDGAIVHADF